MSPSPRRWHHRGQRHRAVPRSERLLCHGPVTPRGPAPRGASRYHLLSGAGGGRPWLGPVSEGASQRPRWHLPGRAPRPPQPRGLAGRQACAPASPRAASSACGFYGNALRLASSSRGQRWLWLVGLIGIIVAIFSSCEETHLTEKCCWRNGEHTDTRRGTRLRCLSAKWPRLPFRLGPSSPLQGCPRFPQFTFSGSFSSQNRIHRFRAHRTRRPFFVHQERPRGDVPCLVQGRREAGASFCGGEGGGARPGLPVTALCKARSVWSPRRPPRVHSRLFCTLVHCSSPRIIPTATHLENRTVSGRLVFSTSASHDFVTCLTV